MVGETPRVVYRGKAGNNSWARYFVRRTMKLNSSNLVSIIGKVGSGKTWSGISICEIMSKMDGVPFTIEHIVFSLTELMELINSGKLIRGSKIIFDEPQASISSKDFMSQANKVFNLLVSTFRHRNFSLFFCCPFETLLDKSTRKLFTARINTAGIDSNHKLCRLLPRFIEYVDFREEPYRKKLMVCYKEKPEDKEYSSFKLDYWDVGEPSKELIEQYEAKKLRFTSNLNLNIQARLQKYDEAGKSMTSENKGKADTRKPLTPTQEKTMKVVCNMTLTEASKILGVSIASVSKNKASAMKKGYRLEEFKQNVEQ